MADAPLSLANPSSPGEIIVLLMYVNYIHSRRFCQEVIESPEEKQIATSHMPG